MPQKKFENFVNQLFEMIGDHNALRLVTNIKELGPIDEKKNHLKISIARWFGLIEKDSLKLTDMGKLFAAKSMFDIMFDYLEGPIPYKGDRFEDLAKDKIFSDPKTYEAMRNYMFDEGDEYEDEEDDDEDLDNNFDDYEDDLDDEDDEDDYPSRRGGKGRRGRR
jgi:hypothetical protein